MRVQAAHEADAERTTAFRALFEAELGYVWNSLRRLGIPERDVEDLVHEVFVVVHRRWDDYDRTRPARPWLFAIAFRVASDYRRTGRNAREHLGATEREPVSAGAAPDEGLDVAERRALLLDALTSVAEERRPVLILHDLDEIAVPDVAAALGIPLNTAYSRLRLAREELASAVRRLQKKRGER